MASLKPGEFQFRIADIKFVNLPTKRFMSFTLQTLIMTNAGPHGFTLRDCTASRNPEGYIFWNLATQRGKNGYSRFRMGEICTNTYTVVQEHIEKEHGTKLPSPKEFKIALARKKQLRQLENNIYNPTLITGGVIKGLLTGEE